VTVDSWSIPNKDRRLIFVQNVQNDPGTHTAPHSKDTVDYFHGIKQPEKVVDQTYPSSVEVMTATSVPALYPCLYFTF